MVPTWVVIVSVIVVVLVIIIVLAKIFPGFGKFLAAIGEGLAEIDFDSGDGGGDCSGD